MRPVGYRAFYCEFIICVCILIHISLIDLVRYNTNNQTKLKRAFNESEAEKVVLDTSKELWAVT